VVVPLFMSEGYFVDEVIPREIEAAPTTDADIEYTEPVGTHPSLTDTVLSRAEEEVRGDKKDVALAVVGHGTSRHSGSSLSAEEHASRLENIFAEVGAVFLDEDPSVSKISDRFESDTVVAVPLFVADGPHVREDVPDAMGLGSGRKRGTVEGTRVLYTEPVGTHPGVSEIAVKRADEVADTDSRVPVQKNPSTEQLVEGFHLGQAEDSFLGRVMSETTVVWGEVAVTHTGEGRYELRHTDDQATPFGEMVAYNDPRNSREIARLDDFGKYRPLLWAPNLPRGWVFPNLEPKETLVALEGFYPGSVRLHHDEELLDAAVSVGLEEFTERHGEMYSSVADADDPSVERTVRACCSENCLRRRLWSGISLPSKDDEGEIPCHEPCSVLVSAVRSEADADGNEKFPFISGGKHD
jgi:sirohydrochlorin cobaltochelatase